jgi:hypothetical protein
MSRKRKSVDEQPHLDPLMDLESFHPQLVWDIQEKETKLLKELEVLRQSANAPVPLPLLILIVEYTVGEPLWVSRQCTSVAFWMCLLAHLLNSKVATPLKRHWSCYLVSRTHCLELACDPQRSFSISALREDFDHLPLEAHQSYTLLMNSRLAMRRCILYDFSRHHFVDLIQSDPNHPLFYDEILAKLCVDMEFVLVPFAIQEEKDDGVSGVSGVSGQLRMSRWTFEEFGTRQQSATASAFSKTPLSFQERGKGRMEIAACLVSMYKRINE